MRFWLGEPYLPIKIFVDKSLVLFSALNLSYMIVDTLGHCTVELIITTTHMACFLQPYMPRVILDTS